MNTANAMMARRLIFAQTVSGRTGLKVGVWRRRLALVWARRSAIALKRMVDIAGSSLLILGFSPILALIVLCIKAEDGGPPIFAQMRVGKHGRLFRMFKFRSMCMDAEARMAELLQKNQHLHGVTFKMKDDPRITKTGKWLRKLSFDELPQLFNILRGDMSLVGPRPPVPREVEKYSLADRRRLHVTPGLTCFWQVGGRAEIDFPQQVELDVLYIERQNFWTDLTILLKTIPAVVRGKGAY
jgi:lipopolysaccharide/colanic/teichoic acid biosynthesis glycosyltransferase